MIKHTPDENDFTRALSASLHNAQVLWQMRQGRAQSRRGCGRGCSVRPVLAQMWQGWAPSQLQRRRAGHSMCEHTPARETNNGGAKKPSRKRAQWDFGLPVPHLHPDWAHPCHICTRTGLTLPHLRRDLGSPLPHLRRVLGSPLCRSAPGLNGARRRYLQCRGAHGSPSPALSRSAWCARLARLHAPARRTRTGRARSCLPARLLLFCLFVCPSVRPSPERVGLCICGSVGPHACRSFVRSCSLLLRRRQALCTWLLFCWLYCPAHLTPILAAHIDLGQLERCAPPTSPQDSAAPPRQSPGDHRADGILGV
jgi:hypothetical protein